jgi:MOSC domain-containing protein YiiM
MVGLDEVEAVPGKGLQGDRYFLGTGSYSDRPDPSREVTLIERESIDAIKRENGIELALGESRRNIVTSGIPLNHLVEREFYVGGVKLRGIRLCEPCNDLAQQIGKPIVTPLLHRAGLRARIIEGGTIRVGDDVREA